MDFTNRVAAITGAAVGIGKATALRLAAEGAKLVLIDINEEKLNALGEQLKAVGAEYLTYICDVSDRAAVYKTFEDALARFGKIDILVNNAAIWRCWNSFLDTSDEEWDKYIDINLKSVVYCTRAVLPGMLENAYGRIINVASVAGVYGNANMVNYSATKGAVIAMTKALAKEVADKGILVNAVSPGSVSPSENDDIDYYVPSELAFIGRSGTDRENANLIVFLASDEASYISAQNIQIDGCRKKQ